MLVIPVVKVVLMVDLIVIKVHLLIKRIEITIVKKQEPLENMFGIMYKRRYF
jgi:hypothetical protein